MDDTDGAPLEGFCLCGETRVAFRPAKEALSLCHCDTCRRWTGLGFLVVGARPGSVESSGPVRRYASSDWAERAWCGSCGSALWYELTLPDHDYVAISAGLVDAACGFELAEEIFIDAKPDGYAIAGAHTRRTRAEMEAIFASFGEEPKQ